MTEDIVQGFFRGPNGYTRYIAKRTVSMIFWFIPYVTYEIIEEADSKDCKRYPYVNPHSPIMV